MQRSWLTAACKLGFERLAQTVEQRTESSLSISGHFPAMKKLALSLAVLAASGAYVWSQTGQDPGDAFLSLAPANAEPSLGAAAPPDGADRNLALPPSAPASPEPAAVILPAPFVIEKPAAPSMPIVAEAPVAPPAPKPVAPVAAASATVEPAPQADAADTSAVGSVGAPATAAVAVPDPLPPRPRPRPRNLAAFESNPLATRVSMTVAAKGRLADGTFTGPAVDAYYGLVQIQAIVRSGQLVGIKVLQYPSDRRTSVAINRQALPMLRDEAVQAQSANVDIVSGATLTSQAFARSLKGALQQANA